MICSCIPPTGLVRFTLGGHVTDSGITFHLLRDAMRSKTGWQPVFRPLYGEQSWDERPCLHSLLETSTLWLPTDAPETWY